MTSVDGQSNETIVLDGEWFEKRRGAQSRSHLTAKFREIIAGLEAARDGG